MKTITINADDLPINRIGVWKRFRLSINNFLGILNLPKAAQKYVCTFLFLRLVITFVTFVSSTFYILYIIDSIGYAQASFIVSFTLLIQMFLDYPSGSLGDWIGQRWILTIAFGSYGLAYFILIYAFSFSSFLLVGLLFGIGTAQYSGALETWLDNNYQLSVQNFDPDRKYYGFSRTRILTLNRFASALAFMVGGFLASTFSRRFVFGFQVFALIFLIIITLILVTDTTRKNESSTVNEKSTNRYFKYLKEGIKFCFSSKAIFFIILGTALFFSAISIWGSILLIPVYFGYTGSDGLASTLRTIIFLNGSIISFYIARISHRFNNTNLPVIVFAFVLLFFPGFMILTLAIPVNNKFNLIGFLIIICLMNGLVPTLADLSTIIRQRIMVDLVPSDYRNSVYSIIPTLTSVFGIFLLPIAGIISEKLGLTAGIVIAFITALFSSLFIYIGISDYKRDLSEL